MAGPDRPHWGWGPLVAMVSAVVLAVAATFLAQHLGANVNWITTMITALVVGGFLALSLMKPRKPKPGVAKVEGGFTMEKKE